MKPMLSASIVHDIHSSTRPALPVRSAIHPASIRPTVLATCTAVRTRPACTRLMSSNATQATTAKVATQNCAQQNDMPASDSSRRLRSRQLARKPSSGLRAKAGWAGSTSSSHDGRPICSRMIASPSMNTACRKAQRQPKLTVIAGAASAAITPPSGTLVCWMENTRLRRAGGEKRIISAEAGGASRPKPSPITSEPGSRKAGDGRIVQSIPPATRHCPIWAVRAAPSRRLRPTNITSEAISPRLTTLMW